MPGEASAGASFAPRVYIPLQNLEATHLIKPGSVARYRAYVKFPQGVDVERRIATLTPQIQHVGLEYDTVEKRKKDLGKALDNLYRFLNLVAFISLLLGAVGVAARFKRIYNKRQQPARFCDASVHPRARLFSFICSKPLRWA